MFRSWQSLAVPTQLAILTMLTGVGLPFSGVSWFISLTVINLGLLLAVLMALQRLQQSLPQAVELARLATEPVLFNSVRDIITAGERLRPARDPVQRDLALQFLEATATKFRDMAAGSFEFHSTERWRVAYEQLLTSPGLHHYRSVAVIWTPSYWQSEAGFNSMQLNHQLSAAHKLLIERVVILADPLWPNRQALPVDTIQEWLIEQHHHGIQLWLVRVSELTQETDLMTDLGIYGSRAVGTQEVETSGATRQFLLRFGLEPVQAAEEKWNRLLVYAVPYEKFLDRYALTE